jgi:hypothetical protein
MKRNTLIAIGHIFIGVAITLAAHWLATLIEERNLYRHQSFFYQELLRDCRNGLPEIK